MRLAGRILAAALACWCCLGSLPALAQDKTPVRLAYLQNDIHHLPLWLALERGFFQEMGVAASVAGVFRSGAEAVAALGAGQLDLVYAGQAPVTLAAARGVPLRVLAQVNCEGSALVGAPGKAAAGIAGLRGKTVAVPSHSSVQEVLLRRALASRGIGVNEVSVIVLSPPEMIPALDLGQIDAFIAWEPYPSLAQLSGKGVVIAGSHEIWPGHPCCVLAARADFLDHSPDRAKAMAMAHAKAVTYIAEHPREAAQVAAKYTGLSLETATRAISRVRYDTALDMAGMLEYVALLNELKYTSIADPKGFVAGLLAVPGAQGAGR